MRGWTAAAGLGAFLGLCGCGDADEPAPAKVPSAPIEVRIDDRGIPHVYARNDADLFFGAGYQMAADRLFQMEMLRRFALGRVAEVLGEEGLERDRLARAFHFGRWGKLDREATRKADPERARLIDAWVKGINRRIEEVRAGSAPLPFGYRATERDFLPEAWAPEDPYVVLKGAGFALDRTIEFEIALTLVTNLYAKAIGAVETVRPAHDVFAVPPEDRPSAQAKLLPPATGATLLADADAAAGIAAVARMLEAMPRPSGSNNWAVDGRFTQTGSPLIAGDPHLGFDFFGAPYPLHLSSAHAKGSYDVAGFAYPGTPGIALGHNRHVMWTATSAFGDVTDVWKVERDGFAVNVGGQLVPITEREEAVTVREPGGPAGQGRVETLLYEDVEGYGVILPNELLPIPVGGPFLVGWPGFTGRPTRWFLELNRVANLDDFEAAVDRMREMNYNFVAADAGGIAYRTGIDVPRRPGVASGQAPWMVLDGADASTLWTQDMLAREELPRSRAPQTGFVVTANNDPFGFTQNGRLDDDPWYYGAFFAPGYRAYRIESQLSKLTQAGSVTREMVEALQRDTHSTLADDVVPLIAAAHAKIPTDPALAEFQNQPDLDAVVQLLAVDWDRSMSRPSAGALAFFVFQRLLAEGVLKDDIPLAYDFAVDLQTVFILKIAAMAVQGKYPNAAPILQGGVDRVVLTAAKQTADWLVGRFGSSDPAGFAYQDMKVTNFDHALGFGVPLFSTPTDGGEDTINVSQNISFAVDATEFASSYVSVERSVGTFSADGTPEAWVNFPLSSNADPTGADTTAALEAYVDVSYAKIPFARADVEAATRETLTIAP